MARIRNRPQAIYVIVAPTGECKIGIAESPNLRLQQLATCFPRGVARLAFASDASSDMWCVERHLHQKLAHRRLNGEWFDIGEVKAIERVKQALALTKSRLFKPDKVIVPEGHRKVVLRPGKPPKHPIRAIRARDDTKSSLVPSN
jgi:hypothetical protein